MPKDEWEDDDEVEMDGAEDDTPKETKAEKAGKVLNSNKPYGMVFVGKQKHYLQKGKIFNITTKKLMKKA